MSLVSIHAPAWGATVRIIADRPALACFNPRPRVGGDVQRVACTHFDRTCFNPRPRVGGDWNVSLDGRAT